MFQGYCRGFVDVLSAYNQITPTVTMSGPTSFAPLIHQAINIVKQTHAVSEINTTAHSIVSTTTSVTY